MKTPWIWDVHLKFELLCSTLHQTPAFSTVRASADLQWQDAALINTDLLMIKF